MANIDEGSLRIDQEIVLDSDRRMASYQSEPTPTPAKALSTQTSLNPSASAYDLKNAGHPVYCIFTVLFKLASLFTYLFLSVFLPNVITFILVIVMTALDFWVVKNVTGRLLVGLRWWSEYDKNGEQKWRFQSFNKQFVGNSVDSAFFWTGQIGGTVIWSFFLFINILSLTLIWGILTGINFALCALNLYGYYKCRGDYKNKLNGLRAAGLKNLAGRIFS